MTKLRRLSLSLVRVGLVGLVLAAALPSGAEDAGSPVKRLLWGDTHLHTSYSFDAFLNNNLSADPDVAYRWAKGEPVLHPFTQARVQIETPLDFLVVSDHAEFLGALRDIYLNGVEQAEAGPIDSLIAWYTERVIRNAIDTRTGPETFADVLPVAADPGVAASQWQDSVGGRFPISDDIVENTWAQTTRISDRHNEPGKFTALIGWEWSSTPGGANLHRIVLTDADAETAQGFVPFASTDSPFPEDLWRWLEARSKETGRQFVSIPHNSNISKGYMFDTRSLRGEPIGADYATLRSAWEPVVEVTQIKGDSETHPSLSPMDQFADFELYPFYIQQQPQPYEPGEGDYVRSALKRGLVIEADVGVNPYRLGMIGSTDSHSGLASAEEPNFWGKFATDSIPANKRAKAISGGPNGWTMSASGLAAIWAEDNTREAIVAALKRREVYASTGPRIGLKLAVLDRSPEQATDAELSVDDALALPGAVPMGGVLQAVASPLFVIEALRDPNTAPLERVQVVKGWHDTAGDTHERVFEAGVAASLRTGDGVSRVSGRLNESEAGGTAEFLVHWRDPEFNPALAAFYYVRVLQVPTARHSLLDALSLGELPSDDTAAVIRERAYSSPVWFLP